MNGRWTDGRVKRGMGGNDGVLRTAQCISYDMSLLKFRVPRSEAYTHTTATWRLPRVRPRAEFVMRGERDG